MPKITQLLPYFKAENLLQERFNTSLGEIAMWVFFNSKGNLPAYNKDGKLFTFRRVDFYQDPNSYPAILKSLFFSKRDLKDFHPRHRFITRDKLIGKWEKSFADRIEVIKFLQGKLIRFHPTKGTCSDNDKDEFCLFDIDEIKKIENLYEITVITEDQLDADTAEKQSSKQKPNSTNSKKNDTSSAFSKFQNLYAREISMIVMEDNSIKLKIRSKKFTVHDDSLGLKVDSQSWKILESAAVDEGNLNNALNQLKRSSDLTKNKQLIATAVSRLRKTLMASMGLNDDPIRLTGNGYQFTFKMLRHEMLKGGGFSKGEDALDYKDNDYKQDSDD